MTCFFCTWYPLITFWSMSTTSMFIIVARWYWVVANIKHCLFWDPSLVTGAFHYVQIWGHLGPTFTSTISLWAKKIKCKPHDSKNWEVEAGLFVSLWRLSGRDTWETLVFTVFKTWLLTCPLRSQVPRCLNCILNRRSSLGPWFIGRQRAQWWWWRWQQRHG